MLTFTYDPADLRPAILISAGTALCVFLMLQCLTLVVGDMDLSWVTAVALR